jgi:acyl-[acyl-carrier-protein] desaturase
MRRKIVMPAHFMRQSGDKVGELWSHFSDAAQRTKVYTAQDYIDILSSLIKDWQIEGMLDLNEAGEKARDYLVALPGRLQRVTDRMAEPEKEYEFKWIGPQVG